MVVCDQSVCLDEPSASQLCLSLGILWLRISTSEARMCLGSKSSHDHSKAWFLNFEKIPIGFIYSSSMNHIMTTYPLRQFFTEKMKTASQFYA